MLSRILLTFSICFVCASLPLNLVEASPTVCQEGNTVTITSASVTEKLNPKQGDKMPVSAAASGLNSGRTATYILLAADVELDMDVSDFKQEGAVDLHGGGSVPVFEDGGGVGVGGEVGGGVGAVPLPRKGVRFTVVKAGVLEEPDEVVSSLTLTTPTKTRARIYDISLTPDPLFKGSNQYKLSYTAAWQNDRKTACTVKIQSNYGFSNVWPNEIASYDGPANTTVYKKVTHTLNIRKGQADRFNVRIFMDFPGTTTDDVDVDGEITVLPGG